MADELDDWTPQEQRLLDELHRRISKHLRGFVETADAFYAIRELRLYRRFFATFELYCQNVWGFSRAYAERLAISGEALIDLRSLGPQSPIASTLKGFQPALTSGLQHPALPDGLLNPSEMSPMGDTPPIGRVVITTQDGRDIPLPENERQVRPLTKLPRDERRDTWIEVVDTAPDGKVTAKHVEAVVDRRLQAHQPPPLPYEPAEIAPHPVRSGPGRAPQELQQRYEQACRLLQAEANGTDLLLDRVLGAEARYALYRQATEVLFQEGEAAEKSGGPTPLTDAVLGAETP